MAFKSIKSKKSGPVDDRMNDWKMQYLEGSALFCSCYWWEMTRRSITEKGRWGFTHGGGRKQSVQDDSTI